MAAKGGSTAHTQAPGQSGVLRLSYSQVTKAIKCAKAWEWQYIHGIRIKSMGWRVDLGAMFDEILRGETDPFHETDLKQWDSDPEKARLVPVAISMVRAYLSHYEGQALSYMASQQEITIPIADTKGHLFAEFYCKLDGLIQGPDGKLWIQEIKTTTARNEKKGLLKPDWRQQVALYRRAAQAVGMDIGGVLMDVVFRPDVRPRKEEDEDSVIKRFGDLFLDEGRWPEIFQRGEYPIDEAMVATMENDFQDLVQGAHLIRFYRDNGFFPTNRHACEGMMPCEFQPLEFVTDEQRAEALASGLFQIRGKKDAK